MSRLMMTGLAAVLLLAGCSDAQVAKVNTALNSPPGQLFCAFEKGNGAQFTGAIIAQVAGAAAGPAAGPMVSQGVILATNATAHQVATACNDAAAVVGAVKATPVPPPADVGNAPQVPIDPLKLPMS